MPSLDAVHELDAAGVLRLITVVTQPDRRGHRGRLAVPPVKERALRHGLDVAQPQGLRGHELD
ncbi:MAG: methionyl-tRNA formyltransferase, partial [Chloroflexota bacterium]|nr:methionyl-tRNA formyltransferase [Chloroflexota bacterium]